MVDPSTTQACIRDGAAKKEAFPRTILRPASPARIRPSDLSKTITGSTTLSETLKPAGGEARTDAKSAGSPESSFTPAPFRGVSLPPDNRRDEDRSFDRVILRAILLDEVISDQLRNRGHQGHHHLPANPRHRLVRGIGCLPRGGGDAEPPVRNRPVVLVVATTRVPTVQTYWPIAAGEILLGEIVLKRRMHSLVTASREIGVGVGVIEQFLVEAGGLPEQDDRPPSRRLFDAQAHAEMLAEIPTLIGSIAMRQAMGATKHELEALEADGVLVPRTRVAKVKSPWRPSDGTALVAELEQRAVPVAAEDGTWETLLLARKRTAASMSTLIEAIRAGRLRVGQRPDVVGFHGFVVPRKEVECLVPTRDVEGEGVEHHPPDLIPAAGFGRSVGLRDNGNFLALIEAGHVPARQVLNVKTGRLQYHLGAEDIASFHRRFVTLTTLSAETGHHRNTLKGLLAASKVGRFAPEGQDFGPVYLRAEVSQAVR